MVWGRSPHLKGSGAGGKAPSLGNFHSYAYIAYVHRWRVAVIVQYGPQWDNYPNDFNISKNCISLIINLWKTFTKKKLFYSMREL